ncbi:hypothetical protein [Nostoc sp. TCL26-01]|nr:hypothetical protein [Nostoc sp. TCL26-01]
MGKFPNQGVIAQIKTTNFNVIISYEELEWRYQAIAMTIILTR